MSLCMGGQESVRFMSHSLSLILVPPTAWPASQDNLLQAPQHRSPDSILIRHSGSFTTLHLFDCLVKSSHKTIHMITSILTKNNDCTNYRPCVVVILPYSVFHPTVVLSLSLHRTEAEGKEYCSKRESSKEYYL